MLAKYMGDGAPPLVVSTIAYKNQAITVKNVKKLKQLVMNYDYSFEVRVDNKWIDAANYFDNEENFKKTTVTAEIEVKEDVDFEELFDIHWRQRVDNVKKHVKEIERVEEVLKFAQEDEQPNSVLNGIEEYLDELRG